VIVEKPFGHDLHSARQLNEELKQVLTENQSTASTITSAKKPCRSFGLPLFQQHHRAAVESQLRRPRQITAAETVGVEHRGGFYETAGALRDMVPNHLFQLLTMTAMEPPISFDADEVRNKQAEVLHAIQPLSPEEVLTCMVRGQYGPGVVGGTPVVGYRSEPDVDPQSNTETFVAMKLQIDNCAGLVCRLSTHGQAP